MEKLKRLIQYFKVLKEKENLRNNKQNQIELIENLIKSVAIENNPKDYQYFSYWHTGKRIKFESKTPVHAEDVKLRTLKYDGLDRFGYYAYTADRDEYELVFNSRLKIYVDETFKKSVEKIQNHSGSAYDSILNKFEISFVSTLNTIQECTNITGFIDEEIQTKCIEILAKFVEKVDEIEDKITEDILKDYQVYMSSLNERLDTELEYLNEYVK